jgi:hypothetical protein
MADASKMDLETEGMVEVCWFDASMGTRLSSTRAVSWLRAVIRVLGFTRTRY